MQYRFVMCVLIAYTTVATAEEANEPTLAAGLIKQARKVQNYCKKQSNATDELIEQGRRNIFSSNREMQCFLQCNLDIGGMMNSKNEITVEPLQHFLPEEWFLEFTRIFNLCGTKEGSDACEIAYNTVLCFAEHNKKYPMLL